MIHYIYYGVIIEDLEIKYQKIRKKAKADY